MKKGLLLFLFLNVCSNVFSTDTLRYASGEIQAIYKRHKFYKSYYKNGKIKYHRKYDTFFRRGKLINYDSIGNTISRGRTIINGREHGRWVEYKNGEKTIVHYKYGIEKNNLRSPEGKHVNSILTYGFCAWSGNNCDEAVNKYRVKYIQVAGCVVNNNIIFKTGIHNFFVYLGKCLRYGPRWEEKMQKSCGE